MIGTSRAGGLLKVSCLALWVLGGGGEVFASGDRYQMYRSPSLLGRGEAGIADVDYEDAVFYNPAGLAQGQGIYKRFYGLNPMISGSMAARDVFRQATIENKDTVDIFKKAVGRNIHLGLQNWSGLILRRAAVGVLSSQYLNIMVAKSRRAGGLESAQGELTTSQGLTFSIADEYYQGQLLVGLTSKYIPVHAQANYDLSVIDATDITEFQSGNTASAGSFFATDLGIMWLTKSKTKTKFGMTINNVGGTKVTPQIENTVLDDFKQSINIGVSMIPSVRSNALKFFADYRDLTGVIYEQTYQRINLGGEISLRGWAGILMGLHQGYPTFGAYVDTRFLRIDAGSYTEDLGTFPGHRPDQRFYFRMSAGF